MTPGDVIEWRCQQFPHIVHRWRVVGVHLGGKNPDGQDTESLIEMESVTHAPGWTGQWEFHPRVFVPEVLVRNLSIVSTGTAP